MTGTLVYAEPFWRHDVVGLRDPTHDAARRAERTPPGAPAFTILDAASTPA
jgi:hypothetical protein